jgi:ketosteroid isomerase-like protein
MSDTDAVLFANEAFYRAFVDRDETAMDSLWSDTDQVACLHPGWRPLYGREEVMDSWKAIMSNPDTPEFLCHDAHAHVHGNTAYVICFEEIGGNFLVATNIFVRDGSLWKMVHHQAGPTSAHPEADDGRMPQQVN